MKKIILDTNIYIDWMNRGAREPLMLATGMVRYLSAVVLMELRAGAHGRGGRLAVDQIARGYRAAGRLIAPTEIVYDRAGSLLRKLKLAGREVRSASLVNDVLIALTARQRGATVLTANTSDFEAIRELEPFAVEGV